MQVLNETLTKSVSGGLDPSQATYAAVLSIQALFGVGVLGACKYMNASIQDPKVTHALVPSLNVIGYIAISELSNWYYANK